MDVRCNYVVHSCNHCCSGKAINITQPKCICNLRYPVRNTHAVDCHLWPAPLYNIFPNFLINDTILEKRLLNTKRVFWFSLLSLPETFLTLRRNERDITHVLWSSYKMPFILVRLLKTSNFSTNFQNILKYQIPLKSVQWQPSCSMRTDEQMDRHDEASSRCSEVCERA
jgi:hypothetical protein